MRVDLRSGGTQNNKFPSFPVNHPSFCRFQVVPCKPRSRHHIRISPSFDADASLIYFGSVEGRNVMSFNETGNFVLKKRLPVNAFHTEIDTSKLLEAIQASSEEKHNRITRRIAPVSSWTRLLLFTSQTWTIPLSSPKIISEPL